MPGGVKLQKISGLSHQLQGLRDRMESQLYYLNAEQMERMQAYQGQQSAMALPSQLAPVHDRRKLGAPYLVNMIKSVEDPTQERFVLITSTEDFNLALVGGTSHGQRKFGLTLAEVAIAVQFEDKNF